MPTNLPPEFKEAERNYKSAVTTEEKIAGLEEMLSIIPKHKGTDKLRADYRKKLSKLKSADRAHKKTGKYDSHFHIEREGDCRVAVIGCANTGKSSLVKMLTHAEPEISDAPFSTWTPIPGMAEFHGVHLQLIDTPALDRDYIEPDFVELIKHSDLVILMIDLLAYPIQQFQDSIEKLAEHKIYPLYSKPDNPERRTWYLPFLLLVNKDDSEEQDEDYDVLKELLGPEWTFVSLSVKNRRNLDKLEESIITRLKLIRVYSKPPHHEADLTQPFVLREGSSVEDFANKVHKDFKTKLKNARIWGQGVYDGQMVGRDHVLFDGDVVELHL